MGNFLDQKTFIDNQKVWSERLLKAVDDKKAHRYFTDVKDNSQQGLSWSFYGLFDDKNPAGHVVIFANFRKKCWVALKESNLLFPSMENRFLGYDPMDMQLALDLSNIVWEYIRKEVQDDLEKDIVDILPKHQGA